MLLKILFSIFLIFCICLEGLPQEQGPGKDSIGANIISPPQKTILGKLLHRVVFNFNSTPPNFHQEYLEKKPIAYQIGKGKTIRHIIIQTFDPFGYSLEDTTAYPLQFTKKAGNALHIKTREEVIRNLLLISENKPFDSLAFKESERLIRSQKYVQDVLASVKLNSPQKDSVDIYFRVIDVWSINPTIRLSEKSQELALADNNFMGLGNRLSIHSRFGKSISGVISQIGYTIPNIYNSHITGNFQYYIAGNNHIINHPEIRKPSYSPLSYNLPTLTLSNRYLIKSFELTRPLFSPLTQWAGGIFIGQLVTRQSYIVNDSVRYLSSKTNIQDYWAAWSWPVSKLNSPIARTTKFILSARMLKTTYPQSIRVSQTTKLFNSENFYLAGVGISSRRYIQDRYVFNYGKIEDIPEGRAFGLTTGFLQKSSQFYLGLKAAWGNNHPFGYLSSHLEYGTFIRSTGFIQQVITGKINYYTPLFNLGYWSIRQFIKPTLIIGIDRLPTDHLSLGEAIQGFEELKNPATHMMVLTLQTQTYAPWEFYGFRFGPYLFGSFGMLTDYSPEIPNSRLYSVMGLGVLIKNNYLLINTFQVSFTYYPFFPDKGTHIFNLNAYKTTDYGLNDFEISRPQVVDFR